MLDALITCGTALFLANFWSKWRYKFFDIVCAIVATLFAFVLPQLAEKFTPELVRLGVLGFDTGGALLGCLLYDAIAYRRG